MTDGLKTLTKSSKGKASSLGLSFPYDWSNPDIPDDALIAGVLSREIFEDVCIVCLHFGFDRVSSVFQAMVDCGNVCFAVSQIPRMLRNIQEGFNRENG